MASINKESNFLNKKIAIFSFRGVLINKHPYNNSNVLIYKPKSKDSHRQAIKYINFNGNYAVK